MDPAPHQRSLGELAQAVQEARGVGAPAEALDAVRDAQELARRVDRALHDAVTGARYAGASWQAIGEVVGTTRQAAFKRFGGSADDVAGATGSGSTIDLGRRTVDVFERLAAFDYAGVRSLMTYTCGRALTKRKLMGVWSDVVSASGRLVACDGTIIRTPDGRTPLEKLANRQFIGGAVVETTLRHESGKWIGRVAYNGSGRITGILIAPPGATGLPF